MQEAQKKRSGNRIRMAFMIICFAMVAGWELAGAVAQARRPASPQQAFQLATAIKSDSCLVEIYAYLRVRALAEELGRDSDILDFALDDLRAGLVDCLNPEQLSGKSEIFDHVTPMDERTSLPTVNRLSRTQAARTLRGPDQEHASDTPGA